MVRPPVTTLSPMTKLAYRAGGRVVGFAAWAYLSEAAEARLQEPAPRLAPANWRSGDRLWLVNIFAASDHAGAILDDVRKVPLGGKGFMMDEIRADGKKTIKNFFPSEN